MLAAPIKTRHLWDTLQEPRCPSYFPMGYLLLLSALDNGWQIADIQIRPSWDQHGLVYLLSLRHPAHMHSQQLVLPKNSLVEDLLAERAVELVNQV